MNVYPFIRVLAYRQLISITMYFYSAILQQWPYLGWEAGSAYKSSIWFLFVSPEWLEVFCFVTLIKVSMKIFGQPCVNRDYSFFLKIYSGQQIEKCPFTNLISPKLKLHRFCWGWKLKWQVCIPLKYFQKR